MAAYSLTSLIFIFGPNYNLYITWNSSYLFAFSGCYFIVDADLKEHGSTKIDSVARSILTTLRHCGRIREVRGGQLTRYVYVDRYWYIEDISISQTHSWKRKWHLYMQNLGLWYVISNWNKCSKVGIVNTRTRIRMKTVVITRFNESHSTSYVWKLYDQCIRVFFGTWILNCLLLCWKLKCPHKCQRCHH